MSSPRKGLHSSFINIKVMIVSNTSDIFKDGKPIIPVFGGTFDPPTIFHFIIAHTLVAMFDKAIIMPSWYNPLKAKSETSFETRVDMCRACFFEPGMEVSELEKSLQKISGSDFVSTYELIEFMNEEMKREDIHYVPVFGMDTINNIQKFKNWENLLEDYNALVVERPGVEKNSFTTNLFRERLIHNVFVPMAGYEASSASSTAVRKNCSNGGKYWKMCCLSSVIEIIEQRGLYKAVECF